MVHTYLTNAGITEVFDCIEDTICSRAIKYKSTCTSVNTETTVTDLVQLILYLIPEKRKTPP